MYCLKYNYHNYNKYGNKIGYEIRCADFSREEDVHIVVQEKHIGKIV